MQNNYRLIKDLLLFIVFLLIFANVQVTNREPKLSPRRVFNEQSQSKNEETAILDFHKRLSKNEWKVYSQNKEDGVIYQLIELLDLTFENFGKNFFVEIGTQSGIQCNSRSSLSTLLIYEIQIIFINSLFF